MTLAAFLAVWFVHLLAAISPGPAVLMAARVGLTEGARRGAWLAVGLGLGAVFWATAALFGLAVLFRLAPSLLWALKIGGAAYLIWLAIKMWRHAGDPADMTIAPATAAEGNAPRSPLSAVWLGIATQLANPKPAVFFGAVFVSTIPRGASALSLALVLIAVFLNEALWNAFVARIFSLDRVQRGYAGLKPVIDRTFGAFLVALGIKIAAT
ncbi:MULTISPECIES: LysE family translocator [Haematobacter]|uniref:Transporter n=1 Tax=Haematobacter genomosp. 1 TaxID=366618 RepID=A0A212ACT6_9RHOB|nr:MULTISPECIES: LysE family translocator [Haematobacter]OWJ78575.1 transporter [Haematobacter genomosp. 1]